MDLETLLPGDSSQVDFAAFIEPLQERKLVNEAAGHRDPVLILAVIVRDHLLLPVLRRLEELVLIRVLADELDVNLGISLKLTISI